MDERDRDSTGESDRPRLQAECPEWPSSGPPGIACATTSQCWPESGTQGLVPVFPYAMPTHHLVCVASWLLAIQPYILRTGAVVAPFFYQSRSLAVISHLLEVLMKPGSVFWSTLFYTARSRCRSSPDGGSLRQKTPGLIRAPRHECVNGS